MCSFDRTNACGYILASIYSHVCSKITCTWVSEFTATSQFCIFSHFSVKLRENGWLNFQP